MKKHILLSIGLFAFALGSCEKEESIYYTFEKTEFVAKQQDWESKNIQNYKYNYSYMASTGPVSETVYVMNGIATVEDENSAPNISTISDVYKRVLRDFDEIQNNNLDIYGVTIKAKYNELYSYPEEIIFTTHYKENIVGGMWYEMKISNFEILE